MEQFISYPSTTVHDDGPEALEGPVKLLQGAGTYESRPKTVFGRIEGAW